MKESKVDELIATVINDQEFLKGKVDKKLAYELRHPERIVSFAKKLEFLWKCGLIKLKNVPKRRVT